MTERQTVKAEKIAQHYGKTHQLRKTIEECTELILAICKMMDAKSTEEYAHWIENIKEEACDVEIMLEQIRYFLGSDEMEEIITSKLDRQIRRIENGD